MSLDYEKLKNWPIDEARQSYTHKDTILYALGVAAATTNPPERLNLVYEKNLQALPTLAVTLATGPFWVADPATGINLAKMLHGEESLTIHRPLAAEGAVISKARVEEIYDKGAEKGAVMVIARDLYDEVNGDHLATQRTSVFLRGNGGFGGIAEGQKAPHPVPDRPADASIMLTSRPEQAAIYRLTGDPNALHIDPAFAKRAGFDRPILHGMCVFGMAGRAVLELLCDGEPSRLRQLDVRFASPVYPGELLRVDLWRQPNREAAFRVYSADRDVLVLNNGFAKVSA